LFNLPVALCHGERRWSAASSYLRSDYCRKQIYYLAQTASQPELKSKAWRDYFRIPFPVGEKREKAIEESAHFQNYLRAIINADEFRFS
jgi:hypothetical protein